MDEAFGVVEQAHGSTLVLTVKGELDLGTAPQLRDRIAKAESESQKLVIDLTGVSFIDSTGVGLLVGTFKRLQDAGKDLVVAAQSPRVLRVFEITNLKSIIPIVSNVDEALC